MPNTIADNLQRLIDAKDAIAAAITDKGGTVTSSDGLEDFPAAIADIPSGGGGGGATILNGSTVPTSEQGNDGDLYFQTNDVYAECVICTPPQRFQFDYKFNEDTKMVLDCLLPAPTNMYDTPVGSRYGDIDHFIAYNGGTLRWRFGTSDGNVGDISPYYNKRMTITFSRTHLTVESEGATVYDIEITGTSNASDTKFGIGSLFTGDNGSDMDATRSSITFYGCKIYENDVLLHDYIPRYTLNNEYVVYDKLTDTEYQSITGNPTGSTTVGDDYIIKTFLKVNGDWDLLIGSLMQDVNTGGGG